ARQPIRGARLPAQTGTSFPRWRTGATLPANTFRPVSRVISMNWFPTVLRRGFAALALPALLPALLIALDVNAADAQGRPPFRRTQALKSLSDHSVVPIPERVTPAQGSPFVISATTRIVVPAGAADAARVGEELDMLLRAPTGFAIPVVASGNGASSGAITLALGGADSLGAEGYALTIAAGGVRVTA